MDKAQSEKCFADSVIEVVSTMTGFEVYEDDNYDWECTEELDIWSLILLKNKEKDYVMSIGMNKETALIITSYMTGVLPEDIKDEDLRDGVCELLNMIAGKAKTCLKNTQYYFSAVLPFSVTGKNILIDYKTKKIEIYKKFLCGDMGVYFKIVRV